MLTCITCSKQTTEDGGEEASSGTPSTKDAVKSLTGQVIHMLYFISIRTDLPNPFCWARVPWDIVALHWNHIIVWIVTYFKTNFKRGSHIKDMTFKVSRKGKPDVAEGSYKKGQRSYPDFDAVSHAYAHPPGGTISTPAWDFPSQVVLEDEEGPKEWTAQVEPGVQITFVSLPRGGNDLKRIRFRERKEASRITASSSRDMSLSNASDIESEWIEEDEPGVEITIRQLLDGTRELRRVRFSCDKFGEVHAKHWWETNRDRIQTQYLS
ncbi:hypothetical protein SASPL_151135 [Salvia splendens]|uniref:BRX domain-containing protein n=1 Tax=Salvia splendens TaxID=180675 RepID=A0A8X8W7G9_SALSN|nr:hypothetical protein SASPL_151135 [Salvia splendens]